MAGSTRSCASTRQPRQSRSGRFRRTPGAPISIPRPSTATASSGSPGRVESTESSILRPATWNSRPRTGAAPTGSPDARRRCLLRVARRQLSGKHRPQERRSPSDRAPAPDQGGAPRVVGQPPDGSGRRNGTRDRYRSTTPMTAAGTPGGCPATFLAPMRSMWTSAHSLAVRFRRERRARFRSADRQVDDIPRSRRKMRMSVRSTAATERFGCQSGADRLVVIRTGCAK